MSRDRAAPHAQPEAPYTSPGARVREIAGTDVADVVVLLHGLAAYERADQCRLTSAGLEQAVFAPAPTLRGHVAEVDGHLIGFALWYPTFSTWDGAGGIHLDDLYVRPESRGRGAGRALLAVLAAECVDHGYSRLQWSVLNDNEPAQQFYRALGARPMTDWTLHRLSSDPLHDLAATAPTSHRSKSGPDER